MQRHRENTKLLVIDVARRRDDAPRRCLSRRGGAEVCGRRGRRWATRGGGAGRAARTSTRSPRSRASGRARRRRDARRPARRHAPPCAASPRGARRGFAPAATRRGGDAPPGAPASATPRAPDDAEGVGEAPAEGRGAGGLAKGCRRMWRMWQGIEARRGGATTHLATPRLDLNETAARERRWRRATVLEYAPTKLH